jgi:hypothetical protein
MEANPEREILLDPRWSILEDGLGYNVLVIGGMPGLDIDGREVVIFTIKPDEIVRKRYNLRRDIELDMNGNMKLTVLKLDLIPLNMFDDANKKWLYTKTLRHEPTELSEREINLQKKLNMKDRRILLIEAENIRLQEQLEIARTNPAKFIKQGAEVFQESAKAFSELTRRPEDKQQ